MSEQPAGAIPPKKTPDVPTTAVSDGSVSDAVQPGETRDFNLGPRIKQHAPQPPPKTEGRPSSFGRYAVIEVLGSGAFGTTTLGSGTKVSGS